MRRPFWYIPSHKDSRHLGSEVGSRVATFEYLRQVGQAVKSLGYEGVLVPTDTNCEDAWVIASLLAGLTARLKFIVAVRPGLMAPSTAARMAATFDRMSAGRLIVNVVGGGDPVELAGDGVFLEHHFPLCAYGRVPAHLATPGRWRGIQLRRQVPEDRKWKRSVPLCTGTPPPAFHGWLVGGRQADCRRTYRHTLEPSRWPTLPRSWRRFALGRRRGAGESTLEFACTLSCAKPTPRPGRPPTIS